MTTQEVSLATTQPQTQAIARPIQFDERFEGFTADDLVMPQAHIVQGLPAELEKYDDVKRGDVVNTLTLEKIFAYDAKSKALSGDNTFAVIAAWPEWVNWPKDADRPLYKCRNRNEVPPSDLEWREEGGKRIPPIATQCFVFIVQFSSQDMPLALTFKKTSAKAGQTLLSLEKMRGRGNGGLYAMTFKIEGDSKQSWIVPVITPKGNVPAELKERVAAMTAGFAGKRIEVQDEAPIEPTGVQQQAAETF